MNSMINRCYVAKLPVYATNWDRVIQQPNSESFPQLRLGDLRSRLKSKHFVPLLCGLFDVGLERSLMQPEKARDKM